MEGFKLFFTIPDLFAKGFFFFFFLMEDREGRKRMVNNKIIVNDNLEISHFLIAP